LNKQIFAEGFYSSRENYLNYAENFCAQNELREQKLRPNKLQGIFSPLCGFELQDEVVRLLGTAHKADGFLRLQNQI
jgi:hypothetical protein